MKRHHRWQADKARTAKALRELPKCEYVKCKRQGMGHIFGRTQTRELMLIWVCPTHAQKALRERQP